MKAIIIYDDISKADNIFKGLAYEGLICKRYSYQEIKPENYFDVKTVLLCFDSKKALSFFLEQSDFDKPICLITSRNNLFAINELVIEKISYIYCNPLNYRIIANDIKTVIYNEEQKSQIQVLEYNGLKLDYNNRSLEYFNKSVKLSNKEFLLMEYFFNNIGKLINKMNIVENVWDMNSCILTNTVDVHISKLRSKLKLLSPKNNFLKTIPCSGYIFD
ncbi:hypothetical protein GF376_00090 [Candidatus Peregrinibacteria bacterium]|nr:hypothetical protein [Candidatus Peregrinibacteria bacterium]